MSTSSDSDIKPTHISALGKEEMRTLVGRWKIDPSHSSVSFIARHVMVSRVRGEFQRVAGTIDVHEEPVRSEVAVEIEAGSINTRDEKRDTHLRSADFLNVDEHPTIVYRSSGITEPQDEKFVMSGELSIRGVTQPVELEVDFLGAIVDHKGAERMVFSATGEVDRESFGMLWNQAIETGGVLVGKRVKIEIEVEALRG